MYKILFNMANNPNCLQQNNGELVLEPTTEAKSNIDLRYIGTVSLYIDIE